MHDVDLASARRRVWAPAAMALCFAVLLTGCVSSLNEDNAGSGDNEPYVISNREITQTFVASENGLDALRVGLRTRGGRRPLEPVIIKARLKEEGSGRPADVARVRFMVTKVFVFYRIPFPAQSHSKGRRFKLSLMAEGDQKQRGGPKAQVAVLSRNLYPQGRAGGSADLGPRHDVLFRTEIEIGPGTALRGFVGRLLQDRPFLLFYVLLLTSLLAALVVVWRKPMSKQS